MCGIVGYIGEKQAAPILLDGLEKLEYRGYDSAGIAVRDEEGEVAVVKMQGRLARLIERTKGGTLLAGSCGIGHTRWATHGEPNEENAHPHKCMDGTVTVVHNGILENYRQLREKLVRSGYTFRSQTDTEVIANLIDYYYKKYRLGPVDTIARFMMRARGSYALAVLFADYGDEIFVARQDSPMVIGAGKGETFIASDVPALLKHTNKIYYIENGELARIGRGGPTFYNIDRTQIEKKPVRVSMDAKAAEKGGWESFMIKEIHEQPKAVEDTLKAYLTDGKVDFSADGVTEETLKAEEIVIVACGSAYHVGITMQYAVERLARVPVRVELASEFRYRRPILREHTLVIAISQSGETADTLAAVREAKKLGCGTLAIVNVRGSSIAREADSTLYTLAGPEIAVATTKAYSTQLIAGYLLALEFARLAGRMSGEEYDRYIGELLALPEKIEKILEDKERLQRFAAAHSTVRDVFMIGRGIDYSVCMEGSLKLKEISYVHTEAYAAGELKHGTISLIEKGTLVVGVITQSEIAEKTVSNLEEVKARGAYVVTLSFEGKALLGDADEAFSIPETDELFAASLAVIPLQLLSYYVSLQRGLDVDKPRNLAKSVTVE